MRLNTITIAVFALIMGTTAAQEATAAAPPDDAERMLVVRTVEDPAISPLPAGCPFDAPNVRLGATVWAFQTRASDAQVVNKDVVQIGTASACGKIIAPLVPFVQVPFYVEFNLSEGLVAAEGFCTVTSNNVPQPGLILAGCALTVVDAPAGVAGGSVTSNSVFNPLRLPGFDTGSIWTLRLFASR